MSQRDEQLLKKAHDARLLHANEHLVYPVLERQVDLALARLCHEFREKGTASLSDVAYLVACQDLKNSLDAVARHGDAAYTQLTKEGKL